MVLENTKRSRPLHSFYSLSALANNGSVLSFDALKGKKVLLVNTASDCGLTPQYKELQQLQNELAESLVVIGFPANDFKEQEQGSDEAIAAFCQVNFGVQFPLIKKSVVVKSPEQHPVFQWLTDATKNGWNEQAPTWNFSKYLVNEEGVLTHFFDPMLSPLDHQLKNAIAL